MGLPDRHLAIDANGSQPLSSPGGSASIAHFRRTSGKGSESYSLRSPRSEERCALSPVNKKNTSEGTPFTGTLSRQAFRPSQKFI